MDIVEFLLHARCNSGFLVIREEERIVTLMKITVSLGKLKFIAVLCDEYSKVYKGRREHPLFNGIKETSKEERDDLELSFEGGMDAKETKWPGTVVGLGCPGH